MKSARIYDFSLTANGSFTLLVEGDYVRVMTSTDSVEIVTDVMRLGPLKAGQGQQDTPFKRITINDKSGNANIGTILVASSGFVDQRINGEVLVIDGEKYRSLSGSAFIASSYQQAVAAEFPYCQLWNPAGSGKNLIVKQAYVSSSTTQSFLLGPYGIALATDQSAVRLGSKKLNAAVGVATTRAGSGAGSIVTNILINQFLVANQNLALSFNAAPFVVVPGSGLTVQAATANTELLCNFEFFEEPI